MAGTKTPLIFPINILFENQQGTWCGVLHDFYPINVVQVGFLKKGAA
jgi:hypothetical protein